MATTAAGPDCLEVRLLGGFAVVMGGRPVPSSAWRRKRAAAIVKLLALEPSHRLHREQLIEALWPDHDPDAAAGHLRFVLHQARQRLEEAGAPPATFLVRDGEGLVLGPPDQVRVDLDAFEQAVAHAWRTRELAATNEAIRLYGGDLLPEDPYEEWAESRRAALRASCWTLLRHLSQLHEGRGELAPAIAALQQLVAAEPTDEEAHTALMRLYAETGQRTKALAQYERLGQILERDLATAPEPATRALFMAIQDGRFPEALRPLAPASPSLLAPATVAPTTLLTGPALPSGTVAFLFTDIEGSTKRWERQPEAMAAALARHHVLLRETVVAHRGGVFKTVGDEVCAVFSLTVDALIAAVAAQRAMAAEPWGEIGPLRVRMAIHAGAAAERDGDYFGPPLNRVARLLAAGHGGQILLTRTARDLVSDAVSNEITLRDLGEHRLKDLSHPERIFQVLGPGLPDQFPLLRTPEGRMSGLPVPIDDLIGRQREVAELRQLLVGARLVTLTGPGGIGKTRLALAVAHQLADATEDGAAFVDLSPVRDSTLVVSAIASVLGLREEHNRTLLDVAKTHLGSSRLLLVLDNFEQVIEAAPTVGELLAACPRLTILVTSRARLRLRGEREYSVRPLDVPDPPESILPAPTPAALGLFPAIALFVERTRQVRPDFQVTDENGIVVAAICRKLDGIPLAIELAAARVRVLPPRAILARLDRPLQLLVGGPRDLPPRQRTMRDTIAWSYDLLSPAEQAFYRRLAVFAGGWTIDAADQVAGRGWRVAAGGDTATASSNLDEPPATLEMLISLADTSLIQRLEQADGEPRFAMLETIRQFGMERLDASGEAETAHLAHSTFYLALAEAGEPELAGPHQAAWLDRLETEHDNLRALLGLGWLNVGAGAEIRLRLVGALWRFWYVRGYLTEGRSWLEQALAACPPNAGPSMARVKALIGAGTLAATQGNSEWAVTCYEEALGFTREMGDERRVAGLLANLGTIAHDQGEYQRATEFHEQALALSRSFGDELGVAGSLHELGAAALELGQYERAANLLAESLALFLRLGDPRGEAVALTSLGALAVQLGQSERAESLYRESLVSWRALGDKQSTAIALVNLGEVIQQREDLIEAEALYHQALSLFDDLEDTPGRGFALSQLGRLAQTRRDLTRAADLLLESLMLHQQVGSKAAIVECLDGLAGLVTAQGLVADGTRLFGAAEALQVSIGSPPREIHREDHDRGVAQARAALDEATFAALWAEGQGMAPEQAVSLVIRLLR